MWKRILEALMAWLTKQQPVPVPVPPPVPVPVPVPVPTPAPVPVPPPVPPAPPAPVPAPDPSCPKPDAVKLGFRGQNKLLRGYRIMLECSPMAAGVKITEGCGDYLERTYGQVEAYQKGPGFDHDPVERASNIANGNVLVIATNYEADWDGDRYKLAGDYEVGVSYPHLSVWRVQRFKIDAKGQAQGIGTNAQAVDVPK